MSLMKSILWTIGIFGIVIFAVACSDDDEGHTAPPVSSVAGSAVASAVESAPASTTSAQRAAGGAATGGTATQAAAPQLATASTEAGIWVTGTGEMSLSPDIAFVRLGVETMAETVTEARDRAASAMAAVVAAVKRNNVADRDIQTTSFNIWADYQYQGNTRTFKGYRVSNTAIVKVRDLDAVGTIIDDAVVAGGDAARINGIDFSIEDRGAYTAQLREAAVKAALENAQHFASLTGVALGKLVYVSEVGNGAPVVTGIAESAALVARAAPPTTVSGGSLDLTLTVQAGFAIE